MAPTAMSAVTAAPPVAIAPTEASLAQTRVAHLVVTRAVRHATSHAVTRVILARKHAVPRKVTGAPRLTVPHVALGAAKDVMKPVATNATTPAQATEASTKTRARPSKPLLAGTTAAPMAAMRAAHPVMPVPTSSPHQSPPARTTAVCACPS